MIIWRGANAAGLRWPLDQEWDEDRLEQALFPPVQPAPSGYNPILYTSVSSSGITAILYCDLRRRIRLC
jgi:hypothetical protein